MPTKYINFRYSILKFETNRDGLKRDYGWVWCLDTLCKGLKLPSVVNLSLSILSLDTIIVV